MSLERPDTPEPRRSGHQWFDLLISIRALVTSGLSMYVAYNNDQSLERLAHANSWPFPRISSGNTSDDGSTSELAFTVKNAGAGPATIYSYDFLVDGRPVNRTNLFANIARACCAHDYQAFLASVGEDKLAALGAVITSPPAPGVLAANEEMPALAWRRTPSNTPPWQAIDRARQNGRVAMRACHCSVFDECWEGHAGALPVRRARLCDMSANAPGAVSPSRGVSR